LRRLVKRVFQSSDHCTIISPKAREGIGLENAA
jgi:hypothetical protein